MFLQRSFNATTPVLFTGAERVKGSHTGALHECPTSSGLLTTGEPGCSSCFRLPLRGCATQANRLGCRDGSCTGHGRSLTARCGFTALRSGSPLPDVIRSGLLLASPGDPVCAPGSGTASSSGMFNMPGDLLCDAFGCLIYLELPAPKNQRAQAPKRQAHGPARTQRTLRSLPLSS